jgi:hypothetical protein
MKKSIIIFAISYIFLEFTTIFLIFSWNSFGGTNDINILQKVITFVFSFPSIWVLRNCENILLYITLNTLFWTGIFAALYISYNKLRKT